MMNKLFEEINCILIVLIDIYCYHTILIIFMILVFWMIKTYVEFLCFLIWNVLISAKFTTFLSSTKRWNKFSCQGKLFIMIADVNESQWDSCRHFCIKCTLLTVSSIQVHYHAHWHMIKCHFLFCTLLRFLQS